MMTIMMMMKMEVVTVSEDKYGGGQKYDDNVDIKDYEDNHDDDEDGSGD